jgi:DMSO/TMAO reductase YedYZ molybdopterin-dependent catalytic subunit
VLAAGPETASIPGLITREREPLNLETPFAALAGPITPTAQFFVRSHFALPTIDMATWRLRIEGAVNKQLEFTYDELRKLPSRTVTATIECAGNSRGFLVPRARGVLWELGAVSTAEWTGVPLNDLLEKAGVAAGAVEVILTGADRGEVAGDIPTPGPLHFERSLPLEKVRRPEVLLAYKMNGADLPPEHGFPLRAVVSGWYGMASVKWLTRMTVTTTPHQGFWQTIDYSYWKREGERPYLVPLTEMQVKSQIARPMAFESVPAGKEYRIYGAAWAGEADVARVEVSTDGGKTWQAATLLGKSQPFTWRLWEMTWNTPTDPGRVRLMARATDSRGRTQPATHDRDRRAYLIHHTLPVDVTVVR